MARIQYQSAARSRGFSPQQLSTAGIDRMREDSNRLIQGMERRRRSENERRDEELQAMKEDAAYTERIERENHKIALYNEEQRGKAMLEPTKTDGAGEMFTGLMQFSGILSKALTEEANRQTKRNVAAALAEPISIDQELEAAKARRAQTDGGIKLNAEIRVNDLLTGADPVDTIKSHVSNPAIVGKAAQVYDNRRAKLLYDTLRDDYMMSTDKIFVGDDGKSFSGVEAAGDANLTRQLHQRLREDVLITLGNPNPVYLSEAFKAIDESNTSFVNRARTEQKKRFEEEAKAQIDTLYSSGDPENIISAFDQTVSVFGRTAALDRYQQELAKANSNEKVLLSMDLKGNGNTFGEEFPNRVTAAAQERKKAVDKQNRIEERLKVDEFQALVDNNLDNIRADFDKDPELTYSYLLDYANERGIAMPASVKQLYTAGKKRNKELNSQLLDRLASKDMLDGTFINSLEDSDLQKRGRELLAAQQERQYGPGYAPLLEGVENYAKDLANFSSTLPGATTTQVELNKVAITNFIKQDLKQTQDANLTRKNLEELLRTASDGVRTNPFSYKEAGTGREYLNIGKIDRTRQEMSVYISKQASGKTAGQVVDTPYLLMNEKEQQEVSARAEQGLPFVYPDGIEQVADMYGLKPSEVYNAQAAANNRTSGKQVPLLTPSPIVDMYDGLNPAVRRTFKSGIENGVSQQVNRALSPQHGRLPVRASMSGNNFTSQRDALQTAAAELGVDPIDLATIFGFETGGTYDPNEVGGEGKRYRGLIQFGEEEREAYGVVPGMTFEEQVLGPVVRFFKDRFAKAGMSTKGATLEDLYTTVIAGNPGANRDAADANGTTARSGAKRMYDEHRPVAIQRFGF